MISLRRLVSLLVLSLIMGCVVRVQPVPGPRPVPRDDGLSPPPPSPPPPATANVLRVREIHAGRVSARVIYAREVHAKGGRVARVFEGQTESGWGGGEKEIKGGDVAADVIYAREIHADWIEADEIRAREVKIGR